MKTPKNLLLERVDRLIAKGQTVLDSHTPNPPNVIGFPTLDSKIFSEWRVQTLHMLHSVVGESSSYTAGFEEKVKEGHRSSAKAGIGILQALREDIENDYLGGLIKLVRAEFFSDFLEMASHLLEAGYKDPAASLAGAVLENGLRQLAQAKNVRVVDRDDLGSLNQKLVQSSVFSQIVRQQIQVWISIRNNADHGKFDQYGHDEVKSMISGILGFIASYLE